ncbi:MAG: hypothetical protein KGZ39_00445, partial [Simkania sp.]|nr:hypothetical protein [Simkania sp.]
SCRQIDDHKQHSINAIQCRLRSPIFGALTRLKCEVICCVWYNELIETSENLASLLKEIFSYLRDSCTTQYFWKGLSKKTHVYRGFFYDA